MYEHWKLEERMGLWHQENVPFTEAERLRYEFLEERAATGEKRGLLGRIFALIRPGSEVTVTRDRADADLVASVGLPQDGSRN